MADETKPKTDEAKIDKAKIETSAKKAFESYLVGQLPDVDTNKPGVKDADLVRQAKERAARSTVKMVSVGETEAVVYVDGYPFKVKA